MNITTLLEMAADAFPDRVAVTTKSGRLNYSQLLNASLAGAQILRSANARYAVLLDVNSMAAAAVLFAAAYAEIPYVPLNYRLTNAELDVLVSRVMPSVLVA